MACLSRPSYPKKVPLNRSHFAYKRCIPFTNLASGIQNWRFAFKYAVFNLQTSISPYKLAPQITTQLISQNNTNNNTDAVSNTFTETKNNNLSETNNNGENQGNEDFNERRDEYRADLLRRVNKHRDIQGLNTLEENDYLQEMAQIRAEELSIRMSHIRPNGKLALGYGVSGEIATKGAKTPGDAFLAFKVSKQHNETMLDREFLTFGSGYYDDEKGKSYWIILFSTSPKPETQRQQ